MPLPRETEKGPRLRLVSAPWSSLYDLPVDAVVEEEDTNRLLGLDVRPPRPVAENYSHLVAAAEAERPSEPGRLLPAGGCPLRLKAILLDLETGRHVDVIHLRMVAERLCLFIESQPVRRLGMPVLGRVHGNVSVAKFAGIFAPRLRETRLETLYILTGPNPMARELRQLRAAFSAE